MSDYHPLTQAVINGKRKEIPPLIEERLKAGDGPSDIVDRLLVPGMNVVGERFKNNEIFVPEMLIAGRAMKEAMTILEPLILKDGAKPKHTCIIGTVEGDLHDIGKNLVALMFKGANFQVVDVGVNAPPSNFIDALQKTDAQLIGLSALLTTTMPAMKNTVKAIRDAGFVSTKIIIGGAPVTREFASEIGADGFAPDAGSAVEEALKMINAL